jgi:AAA family ATP:ADP antiporter
MRLAKVGLSDIASAGEEQGVGGQEAIRLLRESRHLQVIALVIGFAAIGAGLLDQQLNMAVEEAAGDGGAEAIAAFLGQVQLYLSIAGFVIQVWLTSRIHRYLGIGFALLILPVSLGATGVVIMATGALWASAAGRILDSSLRYTVDKTTREILFLPLPSELKHQAKAFVDVTVVYFFEGYELEARTVAIDLGLDPTEIQPVADAPDFSFQDGDQVVVYLGRDRP